MGTEREKLDAVGIAMKKSLATTEDISDSKIKDFIKKGAIKKAREVAKTAKGATKKETRDSVQAAMKESLGKPDKLVGGVYVSQVTETDVELFLEEAAIDEVDSVLSSCVESGDRLANDYDATTALGACEQKLKLHSKHSVVEKKQLSMLRLLLLTLQLQVRLEPIKLQKKQKKQPKNTRKN